MKTTIEIEATPQEMRALIGLPDVEPIQQEVLDKIRQKMLSAVETNNPAEIMKLLMPTSEQFESMESMQASFWQAFGKGLDLATGKEKK